MSRFVVLQHDHPERLHWDFMLDQGESLATWELPMPPAYEHVIPALRLADHRRDYLEYEGPVSAGRGTVVRWDEGDFQWVEKNAGCIVVDLKGEKIVGRVRIDSGAETGDVCWYLTTV